MSDSVARLGPGASPCPEPSAGAAGSTNPRRLGLALFLFLLSIYLLTFSGTAHSSDGIAMLATSESIVRRADLDMNAYLWMGLQQGSFGPDGQLYSRKGMGQTLASLPLAWLGLKLPWLGLVQASLLLGPLVAAATACCLYAAVLALGYGSGAALAVAVLYGLATLALPYSKYDFSDPLTGLALMLAFLALLHYRRGRGRATAAACGLALGFACLARATSLAVVPLFVLAGMTPPPRSSPAGRGEPPLPNPSPTGRGEQPLPNPSPTGRGEQERTSPPHLRVSPGRPGEPLKPRTVSCPLAGQHRVVLPPLAAPLPTGEGRGGGVSPSGTPLPTGEGRGGGVAFAAGLLPMLLLAGWFNYLRFGNPLTSGYLAQESFSGNLVAGVAGLLVSPGKGVFLYAPVLLLSVVGWPRLRHADAGASWLALGVCAAHVLVYGKWFMWHGGYAWGPRFLLPALPFAALALAPLWQRWRLPLFAVGAISLVPQVLGSLVHFAPFQDSLLNTGLPLYDPATFWHWRYSPLLGQWEYVLAALHGNGIALDFSWARDVLGAAHVDLISTAALVAAVALASLALRQTCRGHGHRLLPLAAIALAGAAGCMLVRAHASGSHPLDAAIRLVEAGERPGDAILLTRPADSITLTDRYDGGLPVYGLPDEAAPWLARLGNGYQRLWLLSDAVPLEQSEVETWLANWGYQLATGVDGTWHLALYARPSGELTTLAQDITFADGITLRAAQAGFCDDGLLLRLQWQASDTPQRDLKVFAQAYDASGTMLAQHDGAPDLWRRPTSTWQPGERIEDRHGLLLPGGTEAAYLLVGLYDATSGERLTVGGGDALRLELPARQPAAR